MNIFREICAALREDGQARLATIIGTSGSTPAPAESRMLVRFKGEIRAIGTIGGGCLDASILHLVETESARDSSRTMNFELNDDLGDTGLMCGGTVTVFLEHLTESMLPIYERLVAVQDSGEDCLIVTTLRDGRTTQKVLMGLDTDQPPMVAAALDQSAAANGSKRSAVIVQCAHEEHIIEHVQPDPEVIIIGCGHVGKAVSQSAALAGFRVIVVDDRPEFAQLERFPEARLVLCADVDAAFERLDMTAKTYVVVVTRGHKHDEQALERALKCDLKYVGMIGSRRKVKLIMDNLAAKGFAADLLARVHAPIGIKIGAQTPAEIGISIVAEMIAVRHASERKIVRRDFAVAVAVH